MKATFLFILLFTFGVAQAQDLTVDVSEQDKSLEGKLSELTRQAEAGDAIAQYTLVEMYYHGKGVAKDYKQAHKWYLKVLEQDEAGTQIILKKASTVLEEKAKAGHSQAHILLAELYFYGQGVAKDYVQALKWVKIALENGDEEAEKYRDDIENSLAKEQIAEAERLAMEWLKIHQKQ